MNRPRQILAGARSTIPCSRSSGLAVRSRLRESSRVHLARGARPYVRDRLLGYLALTKPRVIELLLVTTIPAMLLAEPRHG